MLSTARLPTLTLPLHQQNKRRLDELIDGAPSQVKAQRKPVLVAQPTIDELHNFYESIQFSKTGVKPAMLSLMPQYAADYRQPSMHTKLPKFLGDLETEEQVKKDFKAVLEYCQEVDISVTKEQAIYGEQQTREQAKCKTWTRLRTGRITASTAHKVLHTDPTQPSLSLISSICHPSKNIAV